MLWTIEQRLGGCSLLHSVIGDAVQNNQLDQAAADVSAASAARDKYILREGQIQFFSNREVGCFRSLPGRGLEAVIGWAACIASPTARDLQGGANLPLWALSSQSASKTKSGLIGASREAAIAADWIVAPKTFKDQQL